ncbi:AI-2E family transporter [Skermanella rosea]|uniref:AI-2E family transporter n=1 Tax=Skermanella rosea TaxID=1817965 RepID=UPI00193335D1|nr:AI-2E family transporter [Skermanella rosea]UEM01822.1 AI-2E family transporter [Skermanella rosea]
MKDVDLSIGTTSPTARTLRWIALTALALLAVWIAGGFLLIGFAGILVAIMLRALGDQLARATGLSRGKTVLIVTLALILLIGLTCWLLAPRLASQVDELWQTIPQSIDQLRARLSNYSWSETLFRQFDPDRLNLDSGSILGRLSGAASSVMSFLGTLVVVCFIGLYLALDTRLYRSGLVRLFPPSYRPRVDRILDELGRLLKWWLIGRGISMVATGVLTGLGLWLLGIPLALTLALLAAALTFVPYVGAILSAIPALLLGLVQSPTMVLYVSLLYVVVQLVEGYLLTPLIQQETVALPPALTIASLVLFGALLGPLGLMLGTPLAAAGIVLVRMAYVEDVLERDET